MNESQNRTFLIIVALIIIAVGGFWYFGLRGSESVVPTPSPNPQTSTDKTYSSVKYGIEFTYPANYYLEEKELGNAERTHAAIILTEDTEENRAVREGRSPGREGPTAITVEIFQNLEENSIDKWIRGMNNSNFKLSPDGKLTSTTIGTNIQGLTYRWSGLYEGQSVGILHKDNVILLSVTFLTPEDQIRKDFEKVTQSVKLK